MNARRPLTAAEQARRHRIVVESRRAEVARPEPASPGPWHIVVPSQGFWLTDNDSRRNIYAHNRRVQQWRTAAFMAARAVKPRIPTGLDLVQVDVLFRFGGRKPVDEISNLRASVKACVDGAVGRKRGTAPGYGIVAADSDRHVRYGSYEFEIAEMSRGRLALDPYAGELVLTVTDLSGEVASC